MAQDSVRVLQNEYVQRLHDYHGTHGKLYKGQATTAATASIPSKYQTLVIDNSEHKGFLSKSKRFNYDLLVDDRPGPGTYLGLTPTPRSDTSFSKLGTGSFASKDARLRQQRAARAPGPSSYRVQSTLASRVDFSRAGVSSAFHSPIAVDRPKLGGPSPNQYDVSSANERHRHSLKTAEAAFKSRSRRDVIDVRNAYKLPSPCQYNPTESLVHGSVPAFGSSFKSTSSRQFPPAPSKNPGPGQYRPYDDVDTDPPARARLPRGSRLCLSAPAVPLPAPPRPPGPGSYNVPGTFDGEASNKVASRSSAFVSGTGRWTNTTRTSSNLPGPAHYNPTSRGKQSFIYNASSRWL